jgi:urea transporter
MRCDRTEVKQGLYGFNAALVGLAMTVAFAPSMASCALTIGGCAASTAITSAMRRASLSHFTAPFIVSTWATWAIGKSLELNPSQMTNSLLPNVTADPFGALHGLGQVLFQESAVVGGLFVAGLFLSSRKAAVAGLLGAGVGGAVAAATGFSSASIASGLLGYNAALCAIALKDRPAYCAVRHCNMVGIFGDGQKHRQTYFLGPTYLAGLLAIRHFKKRHNMTLERIAKAPAHRGVMPQFPSYASTSVLAIIVRGEKILVE